MDAVRTFKQGLKHSKAVHFLTQPAALTLQAQLLHALLMKTLDLCIQLLPASQNHVWVHDHFAAIAGAAILV